MLNYETLLSSYDDKLTLMQWLKKVEEALKDASAVSFDVNKRGDATLTFSVVFEDGSELETDPIILEQGESVENATLRNGHLILTLTNGDEIDAGNMGAVSGFFINGAQHLIVQYQDGTTNDLGAIFSGNITISGDLTVTGNINGKFGIENIYDNDGHPRFISGNISTPTIAGVTYKYAKWSLSGTHLQLVLFLEVAASQSLSADALIGTFAAPSWLGAKIVAIDNPDNGYVDNRSFNVSITGYSTLKQATAYMYKNSNTSFSINCLSGMTAENDKQYVRFEFNFVVE